MNDIDYNAVIEIINDFLSNEKVEIYGISVGEEFQLRTAIENLLKERQADKDRIKELEDCLQMAKQIMTYDISEDFDFMKLKEFKEYLLNEIKQNENFAD